MATKADFYVGRGPDSEWLGSIAWDGAPHAIPEAIREATDEDAYRVAVTNLLSSRSDGVASDEGWPWTWDDSSKTNYSYAFDKGMVQACRYGSSWWKARGEEPDPTKLKKKMARFPDMAFRRKMGNRVLIVE